MPVDVSRCVTCTTGRVPTKLIVCLPEDYSSAPRLATVIVAASGNSLILALPADSLEEDVLWQAERDGFAGPSGPASPASADFSLGRAGVTECPVLFWEVTTDFVGPLLERFNVRADPCLLFREAQEGEPPSSCWPTGGSLLEGFRAWREEVVGSGSALLSGFETALEDAAQSLPGAPGGRPPPPPGRGAGPVGLRRPPQGSTRGRRADDEDTLEEEGEEDEAAGGAGARPELPLQAGLAAQWPPWGSQPPGFPPGCGAGPTGPPPLFGAALLPRPSLGPQLAGLRPAHPAQEGLPRGAGSVETAFPGWPAPRPPGLAAWAPPQQAAGMPGAPPGLPSLGFASPAGAPQGVQQQDLLAQLAASPQLLQILAAQATALSALSQHDGGAGLAETGASSSTSAPLAGVSARERLVRRAAQQPGAFAQRFLELMHRELGPSSRTAASSPENQRPDPCHYFERYGAFGGAPELGMVQYVLGFILRAQWDGDAARALDLTSLLYIMLEQSSLDQGVVDLGFLYTLLPEPPSEPLRRTPPAEAIRQSSPLADVEWTTAVLGYLAAMDTLNQKRATQLNAARRRRPKPKAKADPKDPKGGKGKADE